MANIRKLYITVSISEIRFDAMQIELCRMISVEWAGEGWVERQCRMLKPTTSALVASIGIGTASRQQVNLHIS